MPHDADESFLQQQQQQQQQKQQQQQQQLKKMLTFQGGLDGLDLNNGSPHHDQNMLMVLDFRFWKFV